MANVTSTTSPNHSPLTVSDANCSFIVSSNGSNNSIPPLAADNDIAGLGVILSFLITAYFTLAATLLAYATGIIPENLITIADRKIFHVKATKSRKWRATFEKAVLTFSDQQMITGIAIIIAGFSRLHTVDAYHWQLIVYLGWMSSTVHLTTLTVLRNYFRQRRLLSFGRVLGMSVLVGLLLAAFVPTASSAWAQAMNPDEKAGFAVPGVPARCFFRRDFYTGITADTPFTYLLLICTFAWKASSLFTPDLASNKIERWFLNRLGKGLIKLARTRTGEEKASAWKMRNFRWHMRLATYIGIAAFTDFCQSFAASLWALTIFLLWGTIVFFGTRHNGPKYIKDQENTWGFGQILPLLLLAIPLAGIWEHFFRDRGVKPENEESKDRYPLELNCRRPNDTPAAEIRDNPLDEVAEAYKEDRKQPDTNLQEYETGYKDKIYAEVLPWKLSEYVAAPHPHSDTGDLFDHDLVAQVYLYKSKFFLSLHWAAHLLLFSAAFIILAFEALTLFEGTGLKGYLWVPIGGLIIIGAVVWTLWVIFGMIFSRLFQ